MADNRSTEQERFDDLVTNLIKTTNVSDFNGALLEGLEHQTSDFWRYMIDYMYHEYEDQYLGHAPIQENDFPGTPSFVEFLNQYIDLDNDTNRNTNWSTIWQQIKDNAISGDNQVWNESLANIIKAFVNAFDSNGRIYIRGKEGEEGSVYISIYDIMHANAGHKFFGSDATNDWVIPNINVDNETYGQVRGNDRINSVLNNDEELQFTSFAKSHYSKTEIKNILSNASSNSYEIYNQYILFGLPWEEVKNNITSDLQKILDFWEMDEEEFKEKIEDDGIGFSQALLSYSESYPEKPEYFNSYPDVKYLFEKASWLRLLMPKYLRKVEVEDLNRNFWVLGQTMSAVCAFLFGPNAPFAKLFEDMAAEITQLWENILYLWLAFAMATQKPEITDVHVEVVYIPNSELEPYLKFDDFNQQVVSDIIETPTFWEELRQRCNYIVQSYDNSHVVIIPKIRCNNYKHNYYSIECWPGIMYFNKTLNTFKYTLFRSQQNNTYGIVINAASEEFYRNCVAIMEDEFDYSFVDGQTILDDDGSGQYNTKPYYLLLRTTVSMGDFTYQNQTLKKSGIYIEVHDIGSNFYQAGHSNLSSDVVKKYQIFQVDPETKYSTPYIEISYSSEVSVPVPETIAIKDIQRGYYQGEFPSWICAWDAQGTPPPPPDVPPANYTLKFEPRYLKPSLFYFEPAVNLYEVVNKYYEDGQVDNSGISAAFKEAYNDRLDKDPNDINVSNSPKRFETDFQIPSNSLGIKSLETARGEQGWQTLNTPWANSVYTYEAAQILENLTRDTYLEDESGISEEQRNQVITKDSYLLYKYAKSLGSQTVTVLDGNLIISAVSNGDRATITIKFNIAYDSTIDALISKENFTANDVTQIITLAENNPNINIITNQTETNKFLSLYENNDAVITNNYYANGKCMLLKGIHDVQLWRHSWDPNYAFGSETLNTRRAATSTGEMIPYYSDYLDSNNNIQTETWNNSPDTYPAIFNYSNGVFDISNGAVLYQYPDHNIEEQLIIYSSFFDAPYGAARYASYTPRGEYLGWKDQYDVYYLLDENSNNIMTKDNWICMYIHYSGIRNPYSNSRNKCYPNGMEERVGLCDSYSVSNFPGCVEGDKSTYVLIARIGIYFLFPNGQCVYATIDRHKDNGYTEQSVSPKQEQITEKNLKTWKIKYFGDFGANNRQVFESLYNKGNFADLTKPSLLSNTAVHEFGNKKYKFFNYEDNGYDPVLYPNSTARGFENNREHIYEYPQFQG